MYMYTRKQQMAKVVELDRKVDAISASVEKKVDDYLAVNLAQVIHFNNSVLETMKEVLTEGQQKEFFELLSDKMDEIDKK